MTERQTIFGALIVFGSMHAYSFFPETTYYNFFLLEFPDKYTGEMKKLLLSPAHYVDYFAIRAMMVYFYYRDWRRYSGKLLLVVLWMWVGYLVDYMVIANQPFMFYRIEPFILPVSYSWICLFILMIMWAQHLVNDLIAWINGER